AGRGGRLLVLTVVQPRNRVTATGHGAPAAVSTKTGGRSMSARNFRATLAADPELGAGNVLLRLAEHGADMDSPRVSFDTEVDGIPAWTPLSLRTLTERVAARAEWFARAGIGR